METMLAEDCAKCLNPKRNDLKHVCERARARGRAARPAPSTERTCWSCLTCRITPLGEGRVRRKGRWRRYVVRRTGECCWTEARATARRGDAHGTEAAMAKLRFSRPTGAVGADSCKELPERTSRAIATHAWGQWGCGLFFIFSISLPSP